MLRYATPDSLAPSESQSRFAHMMCQKSICTYLSKHCLWQDLVCGSDIFEGAEVSLVSKLFVGTSEEPGNILNC